jgi:hypothetical protein
MTISIYTSIMWYLSWPVIIFIAYKIISAVLTTFEKKQTK